MRANPEDLRSLSEDLQGVLHRHPDAIRANPDIQTDIVKVRDKTMRRYDLIVDQGRPHEDDIAHYPC